MMRPVRYKEVAKAPKAKKGLKAPKPKKPATASKRGGQKLTWKQQSMGYKIGIIALIAGLATAGTLAVLFGTGLIKLALAPTPPAEKEYSISVWDGALNVKLDSASFTYDLYGTNTTSWGDADLLESGSDIGDVAAADMTAPSTDNTYTMFWLKFDGVQAHDDDIYGSTHNRGARTYGERWAQLMPNDTNNLITYETPTVVAMHVINANTGALITSPFGGQVAVGANITMIVSMDASKPEQMYVPYFDPSIDDTVQIHISTTFNGVPVRGDFLIAGANGVVSPPPSTVVLFNIGSLMPGTTIISGNWVGPTVSGAETALSSMVLKWGTTALVSL